MCILTEHGQLCGPVHHIPFALSGRLSSRTEWKAEFKDRKTPNWDTRHWMSNFGSMLAAPKGTPTHNLFATLLSDALFTILPGEYHRVKLVRNQRSCCLASTSCTNSSVQLTILITRMARCWWVITEIFSTRTSNTYSMGCSRTQKG